MSDVFLHLGAIRSDYDYDVSTVEARTATLFNGVFTKEKSPQRSHGVDFATLKDGRKIVIVPQVMQNADGKNIIVVTGLDPRLYEFLNGPTEVDKQGITTFENTLNGNRTRIVPVFPTDDPAHWGNHKKHGAGDGTRHSIMIAGAVDFMNNLMSSMMNPGEIFKFLPDQMKNDIKSHLEIQELAKERGESVYWPATWFFKDGNIPNQFAKALSRFIFEASFDRGFK